MEYLSVVWNVFYETWVEEAYEKYTMKQLREDKVRFKNYKYARHATDVTLQHTNRPMGDLREGKNTLAATQTVWLQNRSVCSSQWNYHRLYKSLPGLSLGCGHLLQEC